MNRDFKGIWIPKEIWLSDLSCQEKCLWSEIHSLYCSEKDGCFASNEYLCDFIGVKERRLQEMIANLKKDGWLIQVGFDGRIRTLKAIIPVKINVWQGCGKVHLMGAEKCTSRVKENAGGGTLSPYILENKVERKGEKPSAPTPPNSSKKKVKTEIKKIAFGTYVKLKEGEYETLCLKFTKEWLDKAIEEINDWVPNNRRYDDYAAAIRNWKRREKDFSKESLPVNDKSNPVPNDPKPIIDEKKAICDGIRSIVEPLCNDKTYFNVSYSEVALGCKIKDTSSTFRFGETDGRFKEKLLKEVEIIFPKVKEKIKELFKKYN
jgi:hypothetical protein